MKGKSDLGNNPITFSISAQRYISAQTYYKVYTELPTAENGCLQLSAVITATMRPPFGAVMSQVTSIITFNLFRPMARCHIKEGL